MARKDWYYVNIRNDMADSLDYILDREGAKYGIEDKTQLIRYLVGDFIAKYEENNNIIIARDSVRLSKKRDAMKPVTRQP